jgi:NAD(P)-dependent dehydrogenase (short-subunit alcohol dehydrogenase family)
MPDRIRLDGKVAVVTGAAGVIGTATIRLLAERGARVVKSFRGASEGETRNPEVISARFRVRASRAPE